MSIRKVAHCMGAVLNTMIQPIAHPKMINMDLNTVETMGHPMTIMDRAVQWAAAVLVSKLNYGFISFLLDN